MGMLISDKNFGGQKLGQEIFVFKGRRSKEQVLSLDDERRLFPNLKKNERGGGEKKSNEKIHGPTTKVCKQ